MKTRAAVDGAQSQRGSLPLTFTLGSRLHNMLASILHIITLMYLQSFEVVMSNG